MSLNELKNKLEECRKLWSLYSCDCLHYYMLYLETEIKKYGKKPIY